MSREILAALTTALWVARACVLGALGLGAAFGLLSAAYGYLLHGAAPDASLGGLWPGVYEYLLGPRHVVGNTVLIALYRMPLVFGGAALLGAALLFDKLALGLLRRLDELVRE